MFGKIFNDYYLNNKGILFKQYNIEINKTFKLFDVYWGDPNIIFSKSSDVPYPLAFIKFPKWAHEPETRIYLHEKIEIKYNKAFEYILAHEIGHFCLFDIFGINHPRGNIFLNVNDTEVWADYFAYLYFKKYRNYVNIEEVKNIFFEIDDLQNILYNIPSNIFHKHSFLNKIEVIIDFYNKIENAKKNNEQNILLMLNTFDEILIQIKELI